MSELILELRSVTCHMGSHSVTCHPTEVNAPRLNPSQIGRYSIYVPRRDGRLSWLSSAMAQYMTAWRRLVTMATSVTSPWLKISVLFNNRFHRYLRKRKKTGYLVMVYCICLLFVLLMATWHLLTCNLCSVSACFAVFQIYGRLTSLAFGKNMLFSIIFHVSWLYPDYSSSSSSTDNRGLNARWCLTPLLLSLPTAAYLGQRGLTPAGLPHTTAQCHLTILGEARSIAERHSTLEQTVVCIDISRFAFVFHVRN